MKANSVITNVLYRLKRDFGQEVYLFVQNTPAVQDVETGDVVFDENQHRINKAIVLPLKVFRDFEYDLSFIAANKNFTYGALFDAGTRVMLVDKKDLPQDYELNLNDSFVIGTKGYLIKQYEEFEEGRSVTFIIEELKGQAVREIQ